ncbi:MAG: alpha/beta hydrolase [Bacteroidetes bacterium]|nr:alpha/beta hydrolase [Bacteroidota bacterium]
MIRIFFWLIAALILLLIAGYIALRVSPWPSVLLIRNSFEKGGRTANDHLAGAVPKGVASKLDIAYDPSDPKGKLDLYYPDKVPAPKYPLIIWIHGGGFVAGDKSELSNYCRILASKGYAVAAINYSRPPAARFPGPVIQANKASEYLIRNALRLNIDTSATFLAGDSGGANIAAQLANTTTNEKYAALLKIAPAISSRQLKGVLLYCGPYNTALVDFEGKFGGFLKVVLWAYFGDKHFTNAPGYPLFSVVNYITPGYPRTFISVGNKDPLAPHSYELASKLAASGVAIDSLFFPDDHLPGLQHEYQFDLATQEGRTALDRSVAFLASCTTR